MKIAILGGTFNPVHNGHLMLAEDVRVEFGYDKIIFIPACVPPHKAYTAVVSDEDRLNMLKLATASNSNFAIDDCELRRKGFSYTLDTIYDLESRYQGDIEGKIGLIIGDDLLSGFENWHMAETLAERVRLIVGKRLLSSLPLESKFPFTPLTNPVLPISSSEFRMRMKDGKSSRYFVPESVYGYICERRLYGIFDKYPVDSIKDFVKLSVKPERFDHSLRTAETCVRLCRKYGENEDLGYLAGISHDMCKDFTVENLLSLVENDGFPVTDVEKKIPSLLHGRAAAILLQTKFGVQNPDVIESVRFHTFGDEGMCNLAKILYVADKIEPGRPYVTKEYLQKLENFTLDELVFYVVDENVRYVSGKGKVVAPETYRLLDSLKKDRFCGV